MSPSEAKPAKVAWRVVFVVVHISLLGFGCVSHPFFCPVNLILFSRNLIYIKLTCGSLKYHPSVAVYRGVLVEGITAFFLKNEVGPCRKLNLHITIRWCGNLPS